MPKRQLQSTEFAKGAGKPLAESGNATLSIRAAPILSKFLCIGQKIFTTESTEDTET
jgi:hypothetical protein